MLDNVGKREMTLEEIVDRLPAGHLARREYGLLVNDMPHHEPQWWRILLHRTRRLLDVRKPRKPRN